MCIPSCCSAFQVLGKVFELIALLATESSKLSKKDAFTAITGLVDKMSDIKLKGPAGEALTAMSEALGPQFIFTQLHKRAAAQKNPKVLVAACMHLPLTQQLLVCNRSCHETSLQAYLASMLLDSLVAQFQRAFMRHC